MNAEKVYDDAMDELERDGIPHKTGFLNSSRFYMDICEPLKVLHEGLRKTRIT